MVVERDIPAAKAPAGQILADTGNFRKGHKIGVPDYGNKKPRAFPSPDQAAFGNSRIIDLTCSQIFYSIIFLHFSRKGAQESDFHKGLAEATGNSALKSIYMLCEELLSSAQHNAWRVARAICSSL